MTQLSAEIVSDVRQKRKESIVLMQQTKYGLLHSPSCFPTVESAMKASGQKANAIIVRIPAENETAIDWKARAVELAKAVEKAVLDREDTPHITYPLTESLVEAILKDAGAP